MARYSVLAIDDPRPKKSCVVDGLVGVGGLPRSIAEARVDAWPGSKVLWWANNNPATALALETRIEGTCGVTCEVTEE